MGCATTRLRRRGLSKISELKYSAKSVDMHIYVYINNRVHYKWAIHLLPNGLLFGWLNLKYAYSLKDPSSSVSNQLYTNLVYVPPKYKRVKNYDIS